MAEPANQNNPTGVARKCPICGKSTDNSFRPFCSKRCADVDLQRWLSGRYAIPVVEDEDGPDEETAESGREG